MLKQTPSQTAGPYFSIGLTHDGDNILVQDTTVGRRILIKGKVLDGDNQPVSDALIEIWQTDAQGIYNHPADPRHDRVDQHFRGFGRCGTSAEGDYSFKTIKPGPSQAGTAPTINVRLFARGMLIHAVTRLYFSDESANEGDPTLSSIASERRQTLIAMAEASEDLPTYRFDIHIQGELETVFFNP